ncbi:hypothetical protein TWF481_005471 [Arthrobotrys musiformis]|uniref:Uncharacterized protein n=1 Tax=Arthrobotrys musiformis TaxID=47236 RepID=A0AAV9WFS6_9PEZI
MPSIVTFENQKGSKERVEEVNCRKRVTGLFSLVSAVIKNTASDVCDKVTVKTDRFATWEEYNQYITDLDKSMTYLYDLIDAWICLYKMTDKSASYYTLFLRKREDTGIMKLLNHENAKKNGPATPPPKTNLMTLHLLEDYPKVLLFALIGVTSDIGSDARKLIAKLLERAMATKVAMQTFGKKRPNKWEKRELNKFCNRKVVKNILLEPKGQSKHKQPFDGFDATEFIKTIANLN